MLEAEHGHLFVKYGSPDEPMEGRNQWCAVARLKPISPGSLGSAESDLLLNYCKNEFYFYLRLGRIEAWPRVKRGGMERGVQW